MKVVSVVGARPQFIKAAVVSRELRRSHSEVLLHTGQHYDRSMSELFFDELEIPEPDYNLEVGSGPHGRQTAEMLAGIEEVLLDEEPDLLLSYGDTNSTLAGALAAAKLLIPVGHIEAGMRSFNRAMPEEINRILTDHLSDVLFASTPTAVANLGREGIERGIHLTGDVMYDLALVMGGAAERRSSILEALGLEPGGYALATVHRAENTDRLERLEEIVGALAELPWTVVLPIHPRTRKVLAEAGVKVDPTRLRLTDPVGYLDFVMLERHAQKIFTDSGGVQKEAYFYGIPCVTLRDETEWVETVDEGWNCLVGADRERIVDAAADFWPSGEPRPIFGDGQAGRKIADILSEHSLAGENHEEGAVVNAGLG